MSDIALSNINHLIEMRLSYDVCKVTLALHEGSFDQECNRSSETNEFYPFMAMVVESRNYILQYII